MSFSARGSPDSVQRRRLEMPQFFSTERVKARRSSMLRRMYSAASGWSVGSGEVERETGTVLLERLPRGVRAARVAAMKLGLLVSTLACKCPLEPPPPTLPAAAAAAPGSPSLELEL